MKTFMTTAAILAVLTAPVFAQTGTESKGEPQASGAKESAKDPAVKGQGTMGQTQAPARATTGAASDPAKKDPTKESAGSGGPPEKTGVSTGGGSGGSAGGGGGSGNQ
ncbi:MAG: hypothetical protein QOD94_2754 [Alphaproteobacteria bacterium]|nr:hypothetical protein [Alphaproteobacteria bacterium]